MNPPYREADGAVWVELYAKPGASRSGWSGIRIESDHQAFGIQIQAPPVEGAANEALIRFLEKELKKVARGTSVTLIQGATGKRKRVKIEAIPLSAVLQYFAQIEKEQTKKEKA